MVEQTDEHRDLLNSGAYYTEALKWYSMQYHQPITQRAVLIMMTVVCVFITLATLISFFALLPLQNISPMLVFADDSQERAARIQPMIDNGYEDPNAAVLEWLVKDYVQAYETYNADKLQTFFNRVRAQSSKEVYIKLRSLYQSTSSPTLKYERHTQRKVIITDIDVSDEKQAHVRFTAVEEKGGESVSSRWSADITFSFTPIEVNQSTGAITPMTFQVTNYQSKELG